MRALVRIGPILSVVIIACMLIWVNNGASIIAGFWQLTNNHLAIASFLTLVVAGLTYIQEA